MMKKKSMVAPCRVRIWLYCSPVRKRVVGHRELGADEEGEDPRQGEGEEGGGGVHEADLLVVYGG
jgi:hypothetical protein